VHIGVDASCWANQRGYGRFARELSRALIDRYPEHRWTFLGDARAFEAWAPQAPHVSLDVVDTSESPTLAARAGGSRSLRETWRWTQAVGRLRPDVFFSPSVYTYFPLPLRQRAVVTLHDAIAERFPHLTLPNYRARLLWGLKVRVALAQANVVLTVSDHAARDLERVLGVSRVRIRVATEAPASTFRPASSAEVLAAARRLRLPEGAQWFTYCGGFNPHKRIDLILEAHARLVKDSASPIHLVLVGTMTEDVFHGGVGALKAAVADYGTSDLVHFTGFLPDEELCALHSGAVASLLPSECEGFGLPAVEAAACGTPVIATTESPLPELLAGGGIFVAPGSLDALESGMRRLAEDQETRDRLAAGALVRAHAMSWDAAARATYDALVLAAA
jgi:glycosyltransferase involved in cell wall biosynthesis